MQILVLRLIGWADELSQLKTLKFQVIYIPQNETKIRVSQPLL